MYVTYISLCSISFISIYLYKYIYIYIYICTCVYIYIYIYICIIDILIYLFMYSSVCFIYRGIIQVEKCSRKAFLIFWLRNRKLHEECLPIRRMLHDAIVSSPANTNINYRRNSNNYRRQYQ